MLITINRAELLAAVRRASFIAPSDSPLEVLKGVLLETDGTSGMLTVTSTNLEVSLAERLPCTVMRTAPLSSPQKHLRKCFNGFRRKRWSFAAEKTVDAWRS